MNVKLRLLSVGVLFFLGGSVFAQKGKQPKSKTDTAATEKKIEEVVLVGYGRKETASEKVGNYAVVNKERLENSHFTTVDNALTGAVAGVSLNVTSGQPGANVNMFIRGIGSLTQDTQPLVIIDGIPQITGDVSALVATTNALAGVNSNDIEEIVVLKDAASTSIYGSRGANGVLLIKTKSGKRGKMKFNFNSSYGFNEEAYNKLDLLNAQEHIKLYALGLYNTGDYDSMEDATTKAISDMKWDGKTDTDWKSAVTRKNPVLKTYNFQLNGGTEVANVFTSLSYDDFEGIAKDAVMQRLSATINANFKLSDKMDLRTGFSGSRVNTEGPIDNNYVANPIKGAYQISPTQSIYKIPGDPSSGWNNDMVYYNAGSTFNSVAIQHLDKNKNLQGRITAFLEGNYNISDNFYVNSRIAGYYLNSNDFGYRNPNFGDGNTDVTINGPVNDEHPKGEYLLKGRSYVIDQKFANWIFTNVVGYNTTIKEKHDLKFTLGMEAYHNKQDYTAVYGFGFDQDYASLGYYYPDNSQSSNELGVVIGGSSPSAATLVSYLSGATYSFDKRFTISGTYRRDGSSRFGADRKWGDFWSVGASWNLDKENFMANSIFNELKLRGSYGTQGREPDGFYSAFPGSRNGGYASNGTSVPITINPKLAWEKQDQFNIAIDFGLFKNKISGSVDYFDKKGRDMIVGAFYPGSNIGNTGSAGGNSVTSNVGALTNKGLEFTLNFSPIKNQSFQWDVQSNFTIIKSVVDDLPTGDNFYSEGPSENSTKIQSVGHNPSEWYLPLFAGVDPTNGNQLWYTDGTRSVATADIKKVSAAFTGKNSIAPLTGGLTNTFKYKGFLLRALFSYAGDYSVYDLAGYSQNNSGMRPNINQYASELYDSWTPDNPNATNPKYVNNNPQGRLDSTRYLYDADHIRLKNVELGFTLAKSVHKIEGLDNMYFFVQGQNLYVWAFNDKLYFDPDSSSNAYGNALAGAGIYNITAPIMKTFTFGIKLNF